MKFQSLNDWLNEQKKEEQPLYGCVMMEPKNFKEWEKVHLAGIDKDDVYIKPYDESYGLEEQPHVTILYGIHEDEVDPSVVVDMIEQRFLPVTVSISEISIFEQGDYDVVKYDVPVTDQIKEYRELIESSFANTQTYPEYHPHMTIAYVKPGTGKKYVTTLREPFEIRFSKGVYSYHKEDHEDGDETIRRVVNLDPEPAEKKKSSIVNSKPIER